MAQEKERSDPFAGEVKVKDAPPTYDKRSYEQRCADASIWCAMKNITVEEGRDLFKRAQAGEAEAQVKVGVCFMHGFGEGRDLKKAEELLAKAVKQGNSEARAAMRELKRVSVKKDIGMKIPPRDINKSSPLERRKSLEKFLSNSYYYVHEKMVNQMSPSYDLKSENPYDMWANSLEWKLPFKILNKDAATYNNFSYNCSIVKFNVRSGVEDPFSGLGDVVLSKFIINKDWDKVGELVFMGAQWDEPFTAREIKRLFFYTSLPKRKTNSRSMYQDALVSIKKLVELGLEPNYSYIDGQTLMYHAAANNATEALQLLIDEGADINMTGNKDKCLDQENEEVIDAAGDTPIMVAFRRGHKEMMGLLIKAKADLNVINAEGKTLLDLCDEVIENARSSTTFKKQKEEIDALKKALIKLGAKSAKEFGA